MDARSDEQLLTDTAADPRAFEQFYLRYAEAVIAYFAVRTRQPEVAADLAAETFAAALRASRRYKPSAAPAAAWLFTIAHNKLADAARRGAVADSARRRLSMAPLVVTDEDLERVETLADIAAAGARSLTALLEQLPHDQREAVVARILDERDYPEIADQLRCSEAVVRKRVSRGLATLRAQAEDNR